MNKHPFELEKHRLHRYEQFAASYGIQDLETLVRLYEIDDLEAFLPVHPAESEKMALQALIGVEGEEGYMDYQKSNHTFELIMQWQEQTGNQDQTALSFGSANGQP